MLIRSSLFTALIFLAFSTIPVSSTRSDERISFNRHIRPILAENCFFCHGQDANQRKAGLRLDHRDAAISFGAIEPGDAEASELISRILTEDPDLQMPPIHSNRSLSDSQKNLLSQWIEQGAEFETHWAFVAPTRPLPPATKDKTWARNAIDQFVLAKLEEKGLRPSVEADRYTLIKRLAVDLTGLPPTDAEISDFVNDDDPNAYEKLVMRLIASPHYGERLALPWLDAGRYADSNGFQQDGDTWQWVWRDWVIRALNDDLPFDQFTIWQLAGDLLPNASIDQKIASGFNRNHMLNGEGGAIAEEQRFVILFDRMDTTSTNWLGLTMACAQCHDHKYDPITQRDYYRMMDMFNHVPESGVPQRQSVKYRAAKPFIELPSTENKRRIAEFMSRIDELKPQASEESDIAFDAWSEGINADGSAHDVKGLPKELISLLKIETKKRNAKQNDQLQKGLRKHFDQQVIPRIRAQLKSVNELHQVQQALSNYKINQVPKVMIMSDAKRRSTHILNRGEYLNKLQKVNFDTPQFLPPLPKQARNDRLGFARWLVSKENPLTARVQVNRMWQYFFGEGIVKSTEDLGVQSEYPLHKELLDWLAVEFREQGWSMKKMHYLIVTSATYRQSSKMNPLHLNVDPENRYYARASRFRMPSMILRDWALASSDLLNDKLGGAPVYPYQPSNVWEPLAITKERDFSYPASAGSDLYRRSLYTFWRRTVGPANIFDASNRQACRVRKSITSTPLHALTTLNDPTWVEASRVLAETSLESHQLLDDQISFAFKRVLCRNASPQELKILTNAYRKQLKIYASDLDAAKKLIAIGSTKAKSSIGEAELAALTNVCLSLFNLDEALSRE